MSRSQIGFRREGAIWAEHVAVQTRYQESVLLHRVELLQYSEGLSDGIA
jgi:hypothetical protein